MAEPGAFRFKDSKIILKFIGTLTVDYSAKESTKDLGAIAFGFFKWSLII